MTVETLLNPVVVVAKAETELANLQGLHENQQRELQLLMQQQAKLEKPIAEKLTAAEELQQAISQKQAELATAQAALSVEQKRQAKEFEARSVDLKKKAAAVNAAFLTYQKLLTELVQMGGDDALIQLSGAVKRDRPLQLNGNIPAVRDIKADGQVIVNHGRNLAIVPLSEAQQRNWELVK